LQLKNAWVGVAIRAANPSVPAIRMATTNDVSFFLFIFILLGRGELRGPID
jgi:hypothetical protein